MVRITHITVKMTSIVDRLRTTEARGTCTWLAGHYLEAGHRAERLNCVAADAASKADADRSYCRSFLLYTLSRQADRHVPFVIDA